MIQGTASDVGKSVIVAGLCRWLANQGYKIAPFKPQNMALNSAATDEGLEIGRAQWVQAIAARQPARADFNPVLLKPSSDTGAQVIIHGKALTQMEAKQYHDHKPVAMKAVLDSHDRLQQEFEHIVVEGAGSPAEINLREGDIANMGFAEAVDCPVILVADIDKGGVFAQLVGTLALLSDSEQARVQGFIINKFRGDIRLLEPGLDWLEQRTGKPVFGVLPYCHDLHLAAEDALDTSQITEGADLTRIAVLGLPRMSNHTDFDLFRLHPDIDLRYVRPNEAIPACDLIILPGSKSVIADLQFLKAQGWQEQIARHLRYGGKIFGICGGYQMLGQHITDPWQIEGADLQAQGLGYLPITTELHPEKIVRQVEGSFHLAGSECHVQGYEIHAGRTDLGELKPLLTLRVEGQSYCCGVKNKDDQVAGCYLHGLFENPAAVSLLLHWLGKSSQQQVDSTQSQQERAIERLATTLQSHLDTDAIMAILQREPHCD